MPEYKGIVKKVLEGDFVEAEIVPEQSGIPGASGVNVCHCASEGSRVSFKAENLAGAGVGDSVLVTRKMSGILRNAFVLLGAPFLGMLLGLTVGLILREMLDMSMGYFIVIVFLGLMLGAGSGAFIFRGVSNSSAFVVTEVLKQGGSIEGKEENRSCFLKDTGACEKCVVK
jgi:hypothetical protein